MNKKEWQREKQKDIALLVVGLLRVQIDLRCEHEYREKPPESPDASSSLYEWPNSKASGKDS